MATHMIKAFVVGSSLPAIAYTLVYMTAVNDMPPLAPILVPALFGASNVLVTTLVRYSNTRLKFLLFGLVFGLIVGGLMLWTNYTVLASPAMLDDRFKPLVVLAGSALLHGLLWGVPIYNLNALMI